MKPRRGYYGMAGAKDARPLSPSPDQCLSVAGREGKGRLASALLQLPHSGLTRRRGLGKPRLPAQSSPVQSSQLPTAA